MSQDLATTPNEFAKAVTMNCSRLLDAYKTILKRAQIAEDLSIQRHEELQLESNAETIVFHCQSLLQKIHDLRMDILLRDEPDVEEDEPQQMDIPTEASS